MGRWSGPNIKDGHRLPQRLFPELGGEPLPWPPIVAPGYMNGKALAAAYVKTLDKELVAEHNHTPKWRGRQRQYIKTLRAKWFQRAEGQDEHYVKFGTFPRTFAGDPPTMRDVVVEQWRRREMEKGTFVSNAQHHRQAHRTRSQIVADITKRWGKQAKADGHTVPKQYDPHQE